jgi:hypothetical protein
VQGVALNQINAAMIFTGPDFVGVHGMNSGHGAVGFIDWLDGLAAQTHKTNTINVDAYDQNTGNNEEGQPDPLSKSQ